MPMVTLSAKEFEAIIEELEDNEDVRLYDEAKKNDIGKHIPFSDYLKTKNLKNA